jgi:hypothetical protein
MRAGACCMPLQRSQHEERRTWDLVSWFKNLHDCIIGAEFKGEHRDRLARADWLVNWLSSWLPEVG